LTENQRVSSINRIYCKP